MRVGLLSDTHGYFDQKIYNYFEQVDEIWHAGDIGDITVLEKLTHFKKTRAVYGNIDGKPIRQSIPEVQIFSHDQFKILMLHIAGKFGSYNPTTRELIQQERPSMLVCGHSHILKIAFDSRHGLLYLNPGAAGISGFHVVRTLVRFNLSDNKISELEVIELGSRSR